MNWHDDIKSKPAVLKNADSPTTLLYNFINKVVKNKRDSSYKPQIRFSKLPLCGLLFAQEVLKGAEKTPFSMEWFTNIGTAIHEVFQTHFPLTKDVSQYVYGDWKCNVCKKITVSHSKTPLNLICPCCKTKTPTLSYSELEVNYKGIKGHIDLILLVDNLYYLIDFKSCSQANIDSPDRFLPYPKNVGQIQAYCQALKHEFNINIYYYCLIYVSRDSTDLDDSFSSNKKRHHFSGALVTKKMLAVREEQLDRAVTTKRLVKKFLLKPTKENLKLLNDDRPCRSVEDYENKQTGMKYSFMRKDCPYLQSCCRQGKKWTRASLDLFELATEQEE